MKWSKFLLTQIVLFTALNQSYAQNISIDQIKKALTGVWLNTSDSNHMLTFTDNGKFFEYPVKYTVSSKTDSLNGTFHVEYDEAGFFSWADTVGTGFVIDFDPVAKEGNYEFKRRILMFQKNFLEVATWKGGPYLFRRKNK